MLFRAFTRAVMVIVALIIKHNDSLCVTTLQIHC